MIDPASTYAPCGAVGKRERPPADIMPGSQTPAHAANARIHPSDRFRDGPSPPKAAMAGKPSSTRFMNGPLGRRYQPFRQAAIERAAASHTTFVMIWARRTAGVWGITLCS